MITLGTATKEDIGELMSLHEALRLRYSRTVLCSCLIVLREGETADKEGGKKDAPQVGDQFIQENLLHENYYRVQESSI